MRFTWDEAKRQSNLRKHGFDFADAETVFMRRIVTFEDNRHDYGEDRYLSIGMLRRRIVVIVYTEISGTIRIISMRKATRHEKDIYFAGIPD